jgi:hypothetical protein
MNRDELTLGQIKQIQSLLGERKSSEGLNSMIGKICIIRTYSAGVWFGEIEQKAGNEVIVKNARRMWQWFAAESISLSAVALHGIMREKSKIVEAVDSVWLEAIELIPCTDKAIKSIEGSENVKAS